MFWVKNDVESGERKKRYVGCGFVYVFMTLDTWFPFGPQLFALWIFHVWLN